MFFKVGPFSFFLLFVAVVPGMVGVAQAQVRRAWLATYDGPGKVPDTPRALMVDRDDNVIVTGNSMPSGSSPPPSWGFATLKYSPDGRLLWMARPSGALGVSQPTAMANDAAGNVYVTCSSLPEGSSTSDYLTLKYSPDGEELWVERYDGPGKMADVPRSVAVDAAGNVYVTGESAGDAGTRSDYATVKYDPDGKELWVERYNGPGGGDDRARGIAVDAAGNVYVTGESNGGTESGSDYATVKYDPDGKELWVRRYNGPGSGQDNALRIALDGTGNVLVTGGSAGGAETGVDFATVKYGPDGTEIWVRRWSGPGVGDDWAREIAVDAAGKIYVTGDSPGGAETGADFATIKYSPDGTEEWVRRYDGPANLADLPTGIAVDGFGNVHVTGQSTGSSETHLDFAMVKYDPDGNEAWIARYNGPGSGNDRPCGIALDAAGNVVVAGQATSLLGDSDCATVKLGPDGKLLWVQTYAGPGGPNDQALALALDGAGNALVTGVSASPVNSTTDLDFATVKYAPDGREIWARRWSGPGNQGDKPHGIAADQAGNVLVTGESPGEADTGSDYVTVKYAPDGTELWVERYDGSGNLDDIPTGIAVDGAGNVIVAGESTGSPETGLDFATVKYDPDGREVWVRRYNGPGSGSDRPCGIAVDAAGNILVAGESAGGAETGVDYATVKYAPDGTELWVRRYDGPASRNDIPRGIAIDGLGNVLVTGESYGGSDTTWDYATVKYAPDGSELWARRYDGPATGTDKAIGLAVDPAGDVHVTGSSYGQGTGADWATVKYSPDGTEAWVERYTEEGATIENPKAIALDGAGNVLVAGELKSSGLFATVKYDPEGALLWARRQSASIAVISAGPEGAVYVAGQVSGDYATIRYESLALRRGYIDEDDKVQITDAIVALQYLFLGGSEPPCLDAADIDDSGDLSLTDSVRLLNYLFLGGTAPQEPFSECGRDITLDSIECNVQPSCNPPVIRFYGLDFEADGMFFAVDRSGSMRDSGELDIAKREILGTLDQFPESMEFGIVFFDSNVSKFPADGTPATASPEMKADATSFVQSVAGSYGSCCLQGLTAGLQFANRSTAERKVLFYVGDGGGTCSGQDEATYLRQALLQITAMNTQGVEIHCFGVVSPSAMGEDFMERLAAANGGTYTEILK